MNPWTDEDQNAFREIDEALLSVELAPAPPGLARDVMQRIRRENTAPVMRFRLAWIDYALSLFAASMIGLVVLLSRALPPNMDLYLRMEVFYWIERIRISPLTPLFVIGGTALLAAGFMTFLLLGLSRLSKQENSPA